MKLFDSLSMDPLEDLLERERAAVLAGRLDVLERILIQKQRLLARQPGRDAPVDQLLRLQRTARRNQELLDATAAGIRAALKKIDDFRAAPGVLQTYGPDGTRIAAGVAARPTRRA